MPRLSFRYLAILPAMHHLARFLVLVSLAAAPIGPTLPAAPLQPFAALPLTFTGDAQLRYENHDTTRPGTFQQERLRLTAHLVGQWNFTPGLDARFGARTGEQGNQHSPTLTLKPLDARHDYGQRSVYLDVWHLEGQAGPWRAVAGRMIWPFFSVYDAVWDTDVNPAGLYLLRTYSGPAEFNHTLAIAGYHLPDGAVRFTGRMLTAQVRRDQPLADGHLTTALQWFQMQGEPGARYPQGRANERDYRIAELSLSYTATLRDRPASVGFDLFHNFKRYPATGPDTFATLNRTERTGYSFGLSWGENRDPGDWRVRYNFTHQEALAVNPATSEDTITRLGLSNYCGHDFRFIYSLRSDLTIMPRLTLSEEIVGPANAYRFRLDLSWGF